MQCINHDTQEMRPELRTGGDEMRSNVAKGEITTQHKVNKYQ